MRFPSKFHTALKLSLYAKRLVFILLTAICQMYGAQGWEGGMFQTMEVVKKTILPDDFVGEGYRCMQWRDWFKRRGLEVNKGPDTTLNHSVPCGRPWPLAERKGLLTLLLFSDQLSLALWNNHQLVKDCSWAEGSNLITCITKANHTFCYLQWPHSYIPAKAFWRLGALVEGRNGQQQTEERPVYFS